jgi:integrase
MASIVKRGKRFRVKITQVGSKTLSATFSTYSEATRWAKDTQAKMHLGLMLKAEPDSKNQVIPSFAEAANYYQKTHSIHKKIVRSEGYRLQILVKRWGSLAVNEVDKSAILSLRDELLLLGRSGDTVNHYFNTLSKLYQMLKNEWNLDIPNPIKGLLRMPPTPGRSKRLSLAHEQALLDACEILGLNTLNLLIILAIETGMRRGELLSLNWTCVDIAKRKVYLNTTKNGESRQVPLTQRALSALQCLKLAGTKEVFPMSANVLRNQFEKVKAYARLNWSDQIANPFDDLRFHDLRHEALSRLSDAGLNVIELAYISGHKTMGMLRRYTHPSHQAIFDKLDTPET